MTAQNTVRTKENRSFFKINLQFDDCVDAMVIRVDGCSESPALRRSHVNFSTIVLPDFV